MTRTTLRDLITAVGVAVAAAHAADAAGQPASPAAPPATATHKHYEPVAAAAQAGPDGVLRPGCNGSARTPCRYRRRGRWRSASSIRACGSPTPSITPRRPRVPRSGPPRSRAGDGLLGPGAGPRAEHQRGDEPADEAAALAFVQQAHARARLAAPRERALIEALARRYSGRTADRAANDCAYADAMREVHRRFPRDLDIAMLYVESMMDLRPWNYWMPDGRPHAGTADIVTLTEDVLRRDPAHPAALHLLIHLLEPTATPERAERAADTILTLMPAAGHMIHMASHIYQRVGRYADAIRSNQLAVDADESYLAHCRTQGFYPMSYYPHNIHFLWFAASLDVQAGLATDAARRVAARITDDVLERMPFTAGFRVVPYWTNVRFGRWEAILDEPRPPASNVFLTGAWHYARGTALAATGRLDAAATELAALEALMPDPALDQPLFSPNSGRAIMAIGPAMLAGEIAAARGAFDAAIAHLDRAVRLEDALVYTEPAEWAYPARHALGAVLLEAGRAGEAETSSGGPAPQS